MDALEGWSEFNVAIVGATAALAGLVIVAASVNIGEIVKARSLTARLASAIAGLVLAIAVSALGLVPGMTATTYGVTVLALAVVATLFAVDAGRQVYANRDPANRMRAGKSALAFLTPAVYLVGGAMLVAGAGAGAVVLAVGSLAAIMVALFVSWVVLVEVLR